MSARLLHMRERAWNAWSREVVKKVAIGLGIAGIAALFLQAAATVELVYTIQPSYLLLGLAVVVGAPLVVAGWRSAPRWTRWLAVSLVSAYVASAVIGDYEYLATQDRGGRFRAPVYVGQLLLGMGVVGLVGGALSHLRRRRDPLRLLLAVIYYGAAAVALYGLYQWFAQRLEWPLADVNNALNADGVTRGPNDLGAGVLGWERVRGTFIEPNPFGCYLAGALPLGLAIASRDRYRLPLAAAVTIVGALVVSSSAVAWGLALVGVLVGVALTMGARGATAAAAVLASLAVITTATAPLMLDSPGFVAGITGRAPAAVQSSADDRTESWDRALEIWGGRPVFGTGPGQSSVRLAWRNEHGAAVGPDRATLLGSAHGLWAAALIDVGIVGLALWSVFLIGILVRVARRAPVRVRAGLAAALLIGIAASQVSGDRLELKTWVLLGAALAVTSRDAPALSRSA